MLTLLCYLASYVGYSQQEIIQFDSDLWNKQTAKITNNIFSVHLLSVDPVFSLRDLEASIFDHLQFFKPIYAQTQIVLT